MNHALRDEALQRQGTTVLGRFAIAGDANRAYFESGGEGLVQLATDLQTGQSCRIKCFWNPDQARLERSRLLVAYRLADTARVRGDALGGAPYEITARLGPATPFALVMKDVRGQSWRLIKEIAQAGGQNPPPGWPSVQVRATWAYGLATAVRDLEARAFVHADLSDGNVMVDASGDFALVDFDGFALPKRGVPSPCCGSEGYAAPELWNRQSQAGADQRRWYQKLSARLRAVGRGSDRLGLALLTQEFLLMGHAHLPLSAAFGWSYSQVDDLCLKKGEPHPALAVEFPQLASLMRRALDADQPNQRPEPEEWRRELKPIAEGERQQERLVLMPQHAAAARLPPLALTPAAFPLDLTHTSYGIRATVELAPGGLVTARIHSGATLYVHGSEGWSEVPSDSRLLLQPGIALLDRNGKLSARVAFEGQP